MFQDDAGHTDRGPLQFPSGQPQVFTNLHPTTPSKNLRRRPHIGAKGREEGGLGCGRCGHLGLGFHSSEGQRAADLRMLKRPKGEQGFCVLIVLMKDLSTSWQNSQMYECS